MLESHPAAGIFPMLSDDELAELAEDIKEYGQRDTILLLDGKILDGRNRYRACELAGVEPRTMEWSGSDPLAFVVSRNLKRRHLNASQRAMVAAKIANLGVGQYRGEHNSRSANLPISPTSQAEAAEQLDVSPRAVRAAVRVAREDPEVAEKVMRGEVSVSRADRAIGERGGKTKEAVNARKERIRELVEQGHRSSAIAAEVGVSEQVVNRYIREMGLTPVHEKVGKTRRPDAERAMDSIVDTSRIPQPALDILEGHWGDLPTERIADWIEELTENARRINGVKRELLQIAAQEGAINGQA